MENKREAFFFPARFCGSLVGFVRMVGEIVCKYWNLVCIFGKVLEAE